jgi:hypothetical protein
VRSLGVCGGHGQGKPMPQQDTFPGLHEPGLPQVRWLLKRALEGWWQDLRATQLQSELQALGLSWNLTPSQGADCRFHS